jgi:predicted RNase H-like nuclease
LLERIPLPKRSLEGRLQRQLALHSRTMAVPDPMRIFEEITRFRLMQGILPLEKLHTYHELEALVAAYTAWAAAKKPDEVTLLGDTEEGQIVLPAAALKLKY